jgi:hypothetical protein
MDIVAERAVGTVEELDDAEAVVDRVEQRAIAFLAARQRVARDARLGDVARDAGEAHRHARVVAQDLALARDPAQLAGIGATDPIFDVERYRSLPA